LDVSGLTALTELYCDTNSLTSLDVSGLTALTYLNCSTNSLTSLDVSGLTALTYLNCSTNSLTSLRAVGVVFDSGNWKKKNKGTASGIQYLAANELSATALNQFYTDLDATNPGTGFLDVGGNPGAVADNPSIATNKGYVVFGT
jgi:Leucine-rich repeat (LRR) protein